MGRIGISELTPRQILYVLPSIKNADEDWSDIVKLLVEGKADLWLIEGHKAEGLMITQVVGGYLWVWHFGGEGLWRIQKGIFRYLKDLVRKLGLKGIQGQAPPWLLKLYRRHGFMEPRTVVEWRV